MIDETEVFRGWLADIEPSTPEYIRELWLMELELRLETARDTNREATK